jgi:geranylgeranyl diphosphate synthase type II
MRIDTQLDIFRKQIDQAIRSIRQEDKNPLFYEPIAYVNTLSGKQIRPLLTIISGLAVGGNLETLLFPAAAVELLHNFTLVHDDIMDDDDLRRGKPTVHIKWDLGTAILAGDGLLGLAYRKLLQTPGVSDLRMVRLFTEAMLEICEGQALDKSFENIPQVTEEDYLKMIEKKTATLISLSCQLGGITANAGEMMVQALADFGLNLGLGFQIQDDLLDIYADESKLGKRVGSDLAMHKKTIVNVRLMEKMNTADLSIASLSDLKHNLTQMDVLQDIQTMIDAYFSKAKSALGKIPPNPYTTLLAEFGDSIQNREK